MQEKIDFSWSIKSPFNSRLDRNPCQRTKKYTYGMTVCICNMYTVCNNLYFWQRHMGSYLKQCTVLVISWNENLCVQLDQLIGSYFGSAWRFSCIIWSYNVHHRFRENFGFSLISENYLWILDGRITKAYVPAAKSYPIDWSHCKYQISSTSKLQFCVFA